MIRHLSMRASRPIMKGETSHFEGKTTRFPTHGVSALLFAMTSLMALPAAAQRADDNAVTAASDAFGVTVGLQTIGLYGPINVRGFNPAQAENLRIPGDAALFSVVLTRGPLNMSTAEIDAQYPLVKDVLGAAVSVAHWNDFDYNYARTSGNLGFSLLLRIRPDERSEILPFVGYLHNGERQVLPTVFANGLNPLPMFNEQQLPAQDWTSWGWNQLTAGVVAKSALGSSWRLAAGVFRSLSQYSQNFNDLLLGPTAGGIADHILDVTPPLRAGSYSGDLRLTRLSVDGTHQRELTFDVRGRIVERDYGGDSILGLGSVSIYRTEHFPPPLLAFSSLSLDQVRQVGVGASYNDRWKGVGTLSLGVLETEYRRTLEIPGSPGSAKRTSQVLPTASFTLDAGKHATAYT